MRFPTVLLHHTGHGEDHFDWMLARDESGPLWTARAAHPSRLWQELGRIDLVELPPHRRDYLAYEGPIGDGRGNVRRVDQGWWTMRGWTRDLVGLDLDLRDCRAEVEMRRIDETLWRATIGRSLPLVSGAPRA